MLKTFKYRLYPSLEQSRKMHDACFLCSLLYNNLLVERRTAYEKEQRSLTAFDQIKTLPQKKREIPDLRDVHSQVLQDVSRRLDKAFPPEEEGALPVPKSPLADSQSAPGPGVQGGPLPAPSIRRLALEDLRPGNMLKNHHLARRIADASWGALRSILKFKAEEWSWVITFVDPRHTSQTCSSCGATVRKKLQERWHTCHRCGLSVHRDVNAAINILKRSGLGKAVGDSQALAG